MKTILFYLNQKHINKNQSLINNDPKKVKKKLNYSV